MGILQLLINGSYYGILGFWAITAIALIVNMVIRDITVKEGAEHMAIGAAVVAGTILLFKEYTKKQTWSTEALLRFTILFVVLDILSLVKKEPDGSST